MFSVIKKNKRLAERGDTIVEVLIAIAIISAILSGAYIVVNKSLIAGRESQERGNALKLSQGQIERLKNLSSSNPTKLFNSAEPIFAKPAFCINDANELVQADPDHPDDASRTDDACKLDSQGDKTNEEPVYRLYITRESDLHTFVLTTKWASTQSADNNSVQLIYKAY
jgi:prepilin-type N-terminal cleavage/methylation domain-containing protein